MSYDTWKSFNPADAEPHDEGEQLSPELAYPGLRPMSEAPRDREIIGILHDKFYSNEDPRVPIIHDYVWAPMVGEVSAWFDARYDGAIDSPAWPNWDTSEFLGWLPVPEPPQSTVQGG